ncbi:MAG: LD-carboxypeptidase [Bryobacteraceae bacterium]|nr:LD-carboxypeptidase [Bryobacterales bacterium]MEB2359719.1 LD-carboxypeptidase [Bryobacterales bacterium]NUN00754.1 LD-carboxypeptidase [Bryobacteraceae bacterium]
MNRRVFMAMPGAFAPFPKTGDAIRPTALKPGDTVGLITPATYVSDPDALATAERTLRYFGLEPKFGANVRKRSGYLGGTVEERIEDLHSMFRDPDVKGVFAIRGGYGSGQLLDRIDYDLIRKNPKVFLGYSDITTLLIAIRQRAGLVTFHGPVVLSKFSDYTQNHLRKALFAAEPVGVVTNPPESNKLRPVHTLRTIRPGMASGELIGGNLSLVAATMGTPYEIQTAGRILFLEDVGEEPYSIDRMLTQLRLGGKLSAAAGIVFGECRNCQPRECGPSFESTLSVGEVLDSILGEMKVPVLTGLTIGHTEDQLTLPEGVHATLDADRGELTIGQAVA